jgi:signal transduction histidine kinase/CheY-like chemotaxis protein
MASRHSKINAALMTANIGRFAWALLGPTILVSIFGLSYGLMHNDQIVLAGVVLTLGSILVVFAPMWNWDTRIRAENEQLQKDLETAKTKEWSAEARRITATLGHEIRTPLNGVLGMLGLLLETELSAEQKNYASIAHSSGRTLLSILDEMLDRAKAENGDAARVDLAAVIENVTELLAPRAHAKNIEISSCIAPDVPTVLPLRDLYMRQVLFNLAGNAIKFTEKGGISIRAMRVGKHLQIAIRDTGIGMTAEEQARLFKAYAQANDETSKRYGGTGLGLVISKELIEGMGGSLALESQVGLGTTFIVTLPLDEAETVPIEQSLAGRHYVLAMPDTMLRFDLQKNLESQGATTSFASGEDASLAESATAIVADATSAAALHRMVKARLKRKLHVPQLWLLLNPEERRLQRQLLSKPTTGYLMKPVRRSSLVKQLTAQDRAHLDTQVVELRQAVQVARKSRKLRVLLVEDTPVNALLAKTLLSKAGHETVHAASGRQALDVLTKDRRFDVVLMDVEMADMNGHDATREVRAFEQLHALPRLPILALTANVRPEDIARCSEAGMDGHLAKPFERADLDEALLMLTQSKAA